MSTSLAYHTHTAILSIRCIPELSSRYPNILTTPAPNIHDSVFRVPYLTSRFEFQRQFITTFRRFTDGLHWWHTFI